MSRHSITPPDPADRLHHSADRPEPNIGSDSHHLGRRKGGATAPAFHRPSRSGGSVTTQDCMKYSHWTRKRITLYAIGVCAMVLTVAIGVAMTVSIEIALLLLLPLISVGVIAGLLYWLAKVSL
ncbi:MAG: hypothetical protein HC769_20170 [Cyanobacteria bacterium CRU_2_1]|nr:hypothetical protein [Cyanobacteria bacterium RU_5_0]NJR60933.1 hypothetical protein [Cyanobacteria bacterium CRU_2_1]